MNFKSLDIIKRYLSGDLGLESVAEELHRGGRFYDFVVEDKDSDSAGAP